MQPPPRRLLHAWATAHLGLPSRPSRRPGGLCRWTRALGGDSGGCGSVGEGDAAVGAASAAESERSRLARWLSIQQALLAQPVGQQERVRAAWQALGFDPRDPPDRALLLGQAAFVELLNSAALCPAFSAELFLAGGPLERRTFVAEEEFNGCSRRRQFFRNQILRLQCEKAVLIAEALKSAALVETTAQDDYGDMVMRAVLNGLYRVGDAGGEGDEDDEEQAVDEPEPARQDAPASSPAAGGDEEDALDAMTRIANFALERELYPYLLAWNQGDYFFTRRSRDHAPEELGPQSARTPSSPSRLRGREWYLGEARKVVAPQDGRVTVVQLKLYPLSADVSELEEHVFGDFDLLPVDFLPTVLRRQRAALLALCGGDAGFSSMVQDLVFGFGGRIAGGLRPVGRPGLQAAAPPQPGRRAAKLLENFNGQQRAAVEAALGPGPVTLLEGPPGTGKTTVAAAIVAAWLDQDPETPILVATGTHTAKTLIASRLTAAGFVLSRRMEFRKGAKGAKPPPEAVPVYVETVYMAAEPRGRWLPRVLIDESTQITEAAALVALGQGCSRLVLIGDPKQLGPVSNLGYAGPRRLPEEAPYRFECQSFYELMQERHGIEPVRLNVQYRMRPELRSYPAARFYTGGLVDAEDAAWPSELLAGFPRPPGTSSLAASPLVFIDTAELEERHEETVPLYGSHSLRNRLEAAVVAALVRDLLGGGDVRANEISILTPYGAQRSQLTVAVHPGKALERQRRWRERAARLLLGDSDPLSGEKHPRVHTIDGFQGCENDFVIFSAVRSNPEGRSGFAGEPRRVCVLLTRARKGLIVVGDSSTLAGDEEWACWLRDAAPQRLPAALLLSGPPPDGRAA